MNNVVVFDQIVHVNSILSVLGDNSFYPST